MTRIRPLFAVGFDPGIVIDGIYYRAARIDAGGRVYVNAYDTGASEVKSKLLVTAAPSTTRVTIVTPTAGKAVRILAVLYTTASATTHFMEAYFHTGAHIGVDLSKAIQYAQMVSTLERTRALVFPDGGGPVGAVDEVVSVRTSVDVTTSSYFLVHYREK